MDGMFEKVDLPDRFDPMTVKELRQGLRRGMFLGPFIIIQVLAVAAMYVEFVQEDVLSYERYTGVMWLGLFFDNDNVFNPAYTPFWWVAGGICMVVMPLGALALMRQEMEEGNHELLQMTPITRWKLILGKFYVIWAICMLTFLSLMPYMIVRYFVGGMDVWRNIAMTITVVLGAGIMCSGAIGASAYKHVLARVGILVLFLGSAFLSALSSLGASARVAGECGIFYHLNVLGLVFCYVMFGLVVARSRIRLVVHHYEVKPSWMIIGLLIFTPMVAGMATLMTAGWMGFAGTVAMGFVARYADSSPKAPAWVEMPKLNIPDKDPIHAAHEEDKKDEPQQAGEEKEAKTKPVKPQPEKKAEENLSEPEVWT